MSSVFGTITEAPADPILGITLAYNADPNPNKVNLGVGAYRTAEGKPYVLPVVQKAEATILADTSRNKEYLPIEGLAAFLKETVKLVLGNDSEIISQNRVAVVQSLSGTGALRIAAEFVKRFLPSSTVYISDPTWGNHPTIFSKAGVSTATYRYFDAKTNGLDLSGLLEDLKTAPNKSVVLLHTCAHNPTGVDPTPEQWQTIANLCKEKDHIPIFDTAYQGFASGDLHKDAYSVRLFASMGFELLVCQSYAKNLGLYGERVGAFSVVCKNEQTARALLSHIKLIVRPMYSSPPIHGATIAATVLKDPKLFQEWLGELQLMSGRIKDMRRVLYERLKANNTPGEWGHILSQIGMFSYTGLATEQCEQLISKYHIYMLKNGRISMAGLNEKSCEYLANAIHNVVTQASSAL